MKICILTSVHSLEDTRIFYKQAKSLKNFGYEVHYIVQHDQEETIGGIQINPLKKTKSRLQRMTKTVFEVYRKAIQVNCDCYHFHDPELIPVGLLLKWKGKKVIYDVHEDVPRQILAKKWINRPMRKFISKIVEKIENKCAQRFDGIIAATPHIGKRFLKFTDHVTVLCNYPLLEEFIQVRMDYSAKERAACYVGGISEVRGIKEMVQAIGKTDGNLFIAGSFANKQLRHEIESFSEWSQVKELGFLDRGEVKQVLAKSMVGLYLGHPTSNYVDSLPVKIFEYMAAGIPVIASNFPVIKEIVEGNLCGVIVDPLDVDAIAKRIQWFADHPKMAEAMGRNGRLAVIKQYNWERESIKLNGLYRRITKEFSYQ